MARQTVVLAFSGGLDTSFCVKYLAEEKNLEVHSVIVNTGGFSPEELTAIEERARALGVASHTTLDEQERYYKDCLRHLVFGNVLKNNTYPLSVSAERVYQAMAIAQFAQSKNADFVAHGSTGAGNDQVRFDVMFRILLPDVPVLTPIRDLKLSREAEISFLKERGVEMDWTKAHYSINKGLWGTTIGGKETLTSRHSLPEEAYPSSCTEENSREISLDFVRGEFIGINGEQFSSPIEAIQELARLGESYAIGRDIHVGDTIIGIKGRVGFEAAAPLMIIKAHHLLEKHTLTKWQLNLKDQQSLWYGQLLHEGQFLEPAMRAIEAFFEKTQETVTGKVFVRLEPYRFSLIGVESEHDLMSARFGAYGEMNSAWTGDDVRGFSTILANQTSIYTAING